MNKQLKKYLFILLGIIGGYIISTILSTSTTSILHVIWPLSASQNPGLLVKIVDVSYSTLYIVAGAYIASWISGNISAAVAYGVIFSILGIVGFITGLDKVNPIWYQVYFIVISIPAAYLGGSIRMLSSRK